MTLSGAAGLWLAVLASGLYHGANPGMGWPLAVSAALMGKGRRDLYPALGALAAGHFIAMAVILLPFAMMTALLDWQREIRIGAALLVEVFYQPPYWLHAVVWGALALILPLLLLRSFKGVLIALQFRHKAEEGKLVSGK